MTLDRGGSIELFYSWYNNYMTDSKVIVMCGCVAIIPINHKFADPIVKSIAKSESLH